MRRTNDYDLGYLPTFGIYHARLFDNLNETNKTCQKRTTIKDASEHMSKNNHIENRIGLWDTQHIHTKKNN